LNFNLSLYNPFEIKSDDDFNALSIKIFQFQYQHNVIYKKFVDGCGKANPTHYSEIPFLPIEFFKTDQVVSANNPFDVEFKSSGTTGVNSAHYVKDISIYESSFEKGIHLAYPDIDSRAVLGVLPNYIEQGNSSLVYMVDKLIQQSGFAESGFYLNNLNKLIETLKTLEEKGQPALLIGVSFALLDIAELNELTLRNTIVMETGGMKGRRKEMVRSELHDELKIGFGVAEIHSEYGMTELLSQAYSKVKGLFNCPPWMKVMIRDTNDPFQFLEQGRGGGINVIDLANIYSCSFIATQDLGRINTSGSFEVIGRFDASDVRGCNLMVV
jgi:hypothetical protein